LHLDARIRQHVPLHLLTAEAKVDRPRRGRPPKQPQVTVEAKVARPGRGRPPKLPEVNVSSDVRRQPSRSCKVTSSHSDVLSVGVSRVRSRKYLNVLEAVYIHTRRPELCKQLNFVTELRLFPRQPRAPD